MTGDLRPVTADDAIELAESGFNGALIIISLRLCREAAYFRPTYAWLLVMGRQPPPNLLEWSGSCAR